MVDRNPNYSTQNRTQPSEMQLLSYDSEWSDPCYKLFIAVLYSAFYDLDDRSKILRDRARIWLTDITSTDEMSLTYVCDILDLDPQCIRRLARDTIRIRTLLDTNLCDLPRHLPRRTGV